VLDVTRGEPQKRKKKEEKRKNKIHHPPLLLQTARTDSRMREKDGTNEKKPILIHISL